MCKAFKQSICCYTVARTDTQLWDFNENFGFLLNIMTLDVDTNQDEIESGCKKVTQLLGNVLD